MAWAARQLEVEDRTLLAQTVSFPCGFAAAWHMSRTEVAPSITYTDSIAICITIEYNGLAP